MEGALSALFILVGLGVLEVSLSFDNAAANLLAGIFGLVTYIVMDEIGAVMGEPNDGKFEVGVRTGLGVFLYLEVLDA